MGGRKSIAFLTHLKIKKKTNNKHMTNKEVINSAVSAMTSNDKAEMKIAGIRIASLIEQEADLKREDFEDVPEELLVSFAVGLLMTLQSCLSD
jgi:hypothetical protein